MNGNDIVLTNKRDLKERLKKCGDMSLNENAKIKIYLKGYFTTIDKFKELVLFFEYLYNNIKYIDNRGTFYFYTNYDKVIHIRRFVSSIKFYKYYGTILLEAYINTYSASNDILIWIIEKFEEFSKNFSDETYIDKLKIRVRDRKIKIK